MRDIFCYMVDAARQPRARAKLAICFGLCAAFALGSGCGGTSTRHVEGTGGDGAAGGTGGSGTGGSGTGGSAGCVQAPCVNIAPACPDGRIVSPPCGCPTCSCEAVDCVTADCPAGEVPVRLPGACCDSCEPDLDYCESSDDCVIGYDMATCCACAAAVTKLRLDTWQCPQTVPPHPTVGSCSAPVSCPSVPCDCPLTPEATNCQDHRCVGFYIGGL